MLRRVRAREEFGSWRGCGAPVRARRVPNRCIAPSLPPSPPPPFIPRARTSSSKVFGSTTAELLPHLEGVERHPKTLFSMVTPDVDDELQRRNRKQVVLFGIEAHVCVLQTALDLLDRGYSVWVVVDAVSSSRPTERSVALTRLDRAGVHLTTYESALFELMGDSKAENFKAVSSLIKETRPDPPLPFLHVSTI